MAEQLIDFGLAKTYDDMDTRNNMQSILQAIININNKIDGLYTNIFKLEEKIDKLEKATEKIKLKNETENSEMQTAISDLRSISEKLQNEYATKIALEDLTIQLNEIASSQQTELSITKNSGDENLQQMENAHLNVDQKINELEKAEIKLKFYHLEKALLQTQNQMTVFFSTDENFYCSPDFIWKLKGLKDKLRHKTFECSSKEFILKTYPFRAQLKFSKNSSDRIDVDFHYNVIEDANNGNETSCPRIFLILKDRNDSPQPKHVIRSDTLYFNHAKHAKDTFKLMWTSKDFMKNPVYNVNNSIVFEIYAEPASVAQRAYSRNGILIDNVKDYHKKKVMEEEMLVKGHLSPYFYTAPRGYRVQIEMCLLGCANNNDEQVLIAYVIFLPGEFDSNLSSMFKHKTKITILNRNDPSKNLKRSVIKQVIPEHSFYKINIARPEEIENGNFVANDTLFYKVEIEAVDKK